MDSGRFQTPSHIKHRLVGRTMVRHESSTACMNTLHCVPSENPLHQSIGRGDGVPSLTSGTKREHPSTSTRDTAFIVVVPR